MPDETVLFNKKWVPRTEAVVDIEDRGYQFGDGIYEVIRVYEGQAFLLDEHIQRLQRSAQELELNLPYPLKQIEQNLLELIFRNKLHNGMIYVQISRGVAQRSHAFPDKETPSQLIAYTRQMTRPDQEQKHGVQTILTEDIRWLRCDIKTINLLGNVLAKQKAIKKKAFEAILHRGQIVTEGCATNVFIVTDGLLQTHPANNLILNGITREKILSLAQQIGIEKLEVPFSIEQLRVAEEVFISSTTSEIIPVVKIDNQLVGNGHAGMTTIKLQHALQQAIEQSCKARTH